MASGMALLLTAGQAAAQEFSYLPPGDLAPGSGEGREDYEVYAPGMRFPVEVAPTYVNSQVWGHGGSQGPGGSQCDVENYSYPWRDNYCETRSWDMPMCPAGVGHQGNDMRPSTCDDSTHWAVATVDGTITNIGSYSVYLTAADGTRYDYLHMSNVQVSVGEDVTRGQQLGTVSNEFGGTPTTIHLHFNIRQNIDPLGDVYVPSYMSLVESYLVLINQPPVGTLEQADCEVIEGWAIDLDTSDEAVEVTLAFDGETGDPDAIEHGLTADVERAAECNELSPCSHSFWVPAPLSLFDEQEHSLFAYGADSMLDLGVELDGSPESFTCALPELEGWLRVVDEDAMAGWALSPFWDLAEVDQEALDELPEASPLGDEPTVVTDGGGSRFWVLDGPLLRRIEDSTVARAWRLDLSAAESWTTAEVEERVEGPKLRPRPVLLTADGAAMMLLDDELSFTPPGSGGGGGGAVGGIPGTDSSCACALPSGRGTGGWAVWLLAAGLLRRRRRQRVTGSTSGDRAQNQARFMHRIWEAGRLEIHR